MKHLPYRIAFAAICSLCLFNATSDAAGWQSILQALSANENRNHTIVSMFSNSAASGRYDYRPANGVTNGDFMTNAPQLWNAPSPWALPAAQPVAEGWYKPLLLEYAANQSMYLLQENDAKEVVNEAKTMARQDAIQEFSTTLNRRLKEKPLAGLIPFAVLESNRICYVIFNGTGQELHNVKMRSRLDGVTCDNKGFTNSFPITIIATWKPNISLITDTKRLPEITSAGNFGVLGYCDEGVIKSNSVVEIQSQ